MGVLGGQRPLTNLLSAEGVEAEDYTNPNRLLVEKPPVEAMTPGGNEPGVIAPPIMPAGRAPRGRQQRPFFPPLQPSEPNVPIHEIRMRDPSAGDVDPELAAQMAKPRTRGTNFPPPPRYAPPRDPRAFMTAIYRLRAQQMDLPPEQRVQPRPQDAVIDTDYNTPGPQREFPNLREQYPRQTEGGRMPKNDRTAPLVQHREEIAQRYAQYIRESGILNTNAANFYHIDGPLYRAATTIGGLSHDEALKFIDDFSRYVAATSPRTQTGPNTLNALSVMAKTAQGIPHREILGPGATVEGEEGEAPGISERGYSMMTSEPTPENRRRGVHGKLIDAVRSGLGIDRLGNTKPHMFGWNVAGNRSGVTIDVHIIKGLLMTMNDVHPGSIPDSWFSSPEALAAYKANPTVLTHDMISEQLSKAKVGPRGATQEMQVEYPAFAEILHRTADILGVPQENVADVQAYGWFALGHRTNLGSQAVTLVDIINQRISVTSQLTGMAPREVAWRMFHGQIPLASILGGAVAAGQMLSNTMPQEQQPEQSEGDDIVNTMTNAPPPKMTPEQFQSLTDYMRGFQPAR